MIDIWPYIGYINLVTTIIVPLGVLLHYTRSADRTPPIAPDVSAEAAVFWQRSARRVVGRGRWASGCAIVLAVPFVYMQNALNNDGRTWITALGPLIATAVLIVAFFWRPAPGPSMITPSGQQDDGQQVDRERRTVWSFGRRWWFVCMVLSLAALSLSVIAAGLASSPDANGAFSQFSIKTESVVGWTDFPGWYYGVPILVATAALAAAALGALWWIARPPLATTPGERVIDMRGYAPAARAP